MPFPARASDRYVTSVVCVVSFDRDPGIRLRQREFEQSFHPLFPGEQSINTNLPDDQSPLAPRFIFKHESKALTITQENLQLVLGFDQRGMTEHQRIEVIRRNLAHLDRGINSFWANPRIKDTGLVTTINYPSEQTEKEMAAYLFDRFLKFRPLGTVASALLGVGFEVDNDHYVSIAIAPYEIRTGSARAAGGSSHIFIDLRDLPVSERGIELKIDVNDKPRAIHHSTPSESSTATRIQEVAESLLRDQANDILGVV